MGMEFADRIGMDIMMGVGAVLMGIGTFMAFCVGGNPSS